MDSKRKLEIDLHDERNEMIRYRAKAQRSDVVKWIIMDVVWIGKEFVCENKRI